MTTRTAARRCLARREWSACARSTALEPTTLPTPANAKEAGVVVVYPSANEVAVGDTLSVEYTPPPNKFSHESKATVLWAGGFAEWDPEDESNNTLFFPMMPIAHGRYRVSLCVPNFATNIQFAITDTSGFEWDLNGGSLFEIKVKYQQRPTSDGEVENFDATQTETKHRVQLDHPTAIEPVLQPDVEENLHRVRGEAVLIGEEKGLGNIQISQARDTFDRFDRDRTGTMLTADIPKALELLDFDLEEERINELCNMYVKGEKASMTEFMLVYADLEMADEGIQMV